MKWLWPIVTEYHGQEFSTLFIIRFQISARSPALRGDTIPTFSQSVFF
jgi:hypothetical protein